MTGLDAKPMRIAIGQPRAWWRRALDWTRTPIIYCARCHLPFAFDARRAGAACESRWNRRRGAYCVRVEVE